MTDKLLCPFCQQELDWLSEDKYGNRCCNNCSKLYGSEKLWQALIDTKKKLDMANAELNYVQEQIAKDKALDQINN